MNYSTIVRKDYLDDLEDTDQFICAEGMQTVPALAPTGNWREDLRSYLVNRSPRTGEKLRPRGGEVSRMDFTLTLPKCVSILELLALDPQITAAVVKAVQVCLHLVELLAAPLQQKPDGLRMTNVVAFAALQRLTNDEHKPQPHRHAHLDVLSLAWNPGERFKRVTSANLEVVAHAGNLLNALFQHQVAWELRKMSYGIKQKGEFFTIEGFPDVESRFNAGQRSQAAKENEFRPKGQFAEMQKLWLGELSSAERWTLASTLKTHGQPAAAAPAFEVEMRAAAEQAFKKDFFRPAMDIAAQALRATFGRPTPDPGQLARWATGELLGDAEAVKFELHDGQWCWATPAGLAEERLIVDFIRDLPLADSGWVSQEHTDSWWVRRLAANHHRVAVLKADLEDAEVAQLQVRLGQVTRLVRDLDSMSLRRNAGLFMDDLKAGRRVLFLQAVKAPRQSLWLNELPAAAGVPVIWENMTDRQANGRLHGLDVSFSVGKAVEVFAAKLSHKKSAFLIASFKGHADLNAEVRRLRAAGSKRERKAVHRLALVEAKEFIRPGLLMQFERNAGGFKATELMTILAVEEDRIVVERPGGIRAIVSYGYSKNYRQYQAAQLELERGDRIRLTRNNGADAVKTGLRRDRRFTVKRVTPEGTVLLDGGRVLPPEAGHWEYGFCIGLLT
jgi:hypothetical protein